MGNRGSHTARSGQEPHTPGGTDANTTPSAWRSVTLPWTARGIERKGTGVQCASAWSFRSTGTPSWSTLHPWRRASILASRSMTRHASFKTLSSTTSRSPLDMRLCKLTTLNLSRSDSGVAGGGSRSCSRTVSWLPITTTVSPSFLRHASQQLVACARHRKTLKSGGSSTPLRRTMSLGCAHAIPVKRCHPSKKPLPRGSLPGWSLLS